MRDDLILTDGAKQMLSDAGIPILQRGWDVHELLKRIPESLQTDNNETYHIDISFIGNGSWWVKYKSYPSNQPMQKQSYGIGWIAPSLPDALVMCLVELHKNGDDVCWG